MNLNFFYDQFYHKIFSYKHQKYLSHLIYNKLIKMDIATMKNDINYNIKSSLLYISFVSSQWNVLF